MMISKNEIKYIQSLFHKKNRAAENTFIAEGVKITSELLYSDFIIKKIYALKDWACPLPTKATIQVIEDFELEKISNLETPNQVLVIAETKKNNNEPITKNTVSLVVDGIRDPGNLGTIIRIADWFGINQVIASEDTADIYNPKVVQSSMGSLFRINFWYKDLETFLPAAQTNIFGAVMNGNDVYSQEKIKEGLIVIGNESNGISKNILPHLTHHITITRKGHAESLNAAVAAGIIVSHLV